MTVYYNNFSSWQDIVDEFTGNMYKAEKDKIIIAEPDKVLYADYNLDGYEGSALVIYRDKGKYYLLEGSHCSCNGLSDIGFSPELYNSKQEFLNYLHKVNYLMTGVDKEHIINLVGDDNMAIKIETKTTYTTSDGKVFDDLIDAEKHELELARRISDLKKKFVQHNRYNSNSMEDYAIWEVTGLSGESFGYFEGTYEKVLTRALLNPTFVTYDEKEFGDIFRIVIEKLE